MRLASLVGTNEGALRVNDRHQRSMVNEDIGFFDCEFEGEDVQELAFNAANVAEAENAAAHRPVDVFQGRVVDKLCQEKQSE